MTATEPASDRPLRGRRVSADEYYRLTGRRLKAANDDTPPAKETDDE
jgi:hypothetical protein